MEDHFHAAYEESDDYGPEGHRTQSPSDQMGAFVDDLMARLRPSAANFQGAVANFVARYLAGLDVYVYVGLLVAFFFFYQLVIKPYVGRRVEGFRRWRADRRDRAEEAALKKNPDLLRARTEAMRSARAKQLEAHEARTREFADRAKRKVVGAKGPFAAGSNPDYYPLASSVGVCYRPVAGRGQSQGGG